MQDTVKKLYDFPRATSATLIDQIMGKWRTEVIYLMNYARNANLWFDTFELISLHNVFVSRLKELKMQIKCELGGQPQLAK